MYFMLNYKFLSIHLDVHSEWVSGWVGEWVGEWVSERASELSIVSKGKPETYTRDATLKQTSHKYK